MEFEETFWDVVYDDIQWDIPGEVLPLDFSKQLPLDSPELPTVDLAVSVLGGEPRSLPHLLAIDNTIQDSNETWQLIHNHTIADLVSDPAPQVQYKRR